MNMILRICCYLALASAISASLSQSTTVDQIKPSTSATKLLQHCHSEPNPNIDWESFGFGLNNVRTDFMYHEQIRVGKEDFSTLVASKCIAEGPLTLHPSCTVLNYGQSLFEGMKAFRRIDGTIALFRPEKNAERMANGARRLLLPPVSPDTFVKAADRVVKKNARWVPPFGKGALYLRPLLFGSGEELGVKPSSEATFCIYCSPVGNYFKNGLQGISLQAVRGYARAAPGGSGSVKAGGNYAPSFLMQKEVRERGYDEALFLDAIHGEFIEEAGASNFFAVFPNNTIVTPPLTDTILPGVTRNSIIELARSQCNCEVYERRLTIHDLKEVKEAFCCGTGASITPVSRVSFLSEKNAKEPDFDIVFGDGKEPGMVTQQLYALLLAIQTGTDKSLSEKYSHWIHIVDPIDE